MTMCFPNAVMYKCLLLPLSLFAHDNQTFKLKMVNIPVKSPHSLCNHEFWATLSAPLKYLSQRKQPTPLCFMPKKEKSFMEVWRNLSLKRPFCCDWVGTPQNFHVLPLARFYLRAEMCLLCAACRECKGEKFKLPLSADTQCLLFNQEVCEQKQASQCLTLVSTAPPLSPPDPHHPWQPVTLVRLPRPCGWPWF